MYFNETWYPSTSETLNLSSTTNGLRLNSLGLGQTFLTNTTSSLPLDNNANVVFGGNTDGKGFESWFYAVSNQIASQGMGNCATCLIPNIYNVTTTRLRAVNYNQQNLFFNLNILSNSPSTFYYILPAFTSNYVASKTYFNANAANAVNNQNIWQYALPITNIIFNFSYKSYATGNSMITTPVYFNYSGYQSVPYLVMNITHFVEMGNSCYNMYLNENYYNSTINTGFGVPFYILNCSSNSRYAQILVANTAFNGNPYNSLWVYYGGAVNYNINPSNNIIYNQWKFASGTDITANDMDTFPFVIHLSQPLNLLSYIQTCWQSTTYGCIFHTNYSTTLSKDIIHFYGDGSSPAFTLNSIAESSQLFFADFNSTGDNNFVAPLLRYYLTYRADTGLALNQTQMANQGEGAGGTVSYIETVMKASGNASYEHLYTTIYHQGSPLGITTFTQNITLPFTNTTTTIPPTSNGITYNATTTINIANVLIPQTIIGDTQISLPTALIMFIQIIMMILAFVAIYSEEGFLTGVIFILIMWFVGFFSYELLTIAVIGTIMLVVEHYIVQKHRHTRGKGRSGGGSRPQYHGGRMLPPVSFNT
jgi:hypothetical protein